MKKNKESGFVLAETLIVTVFLMTMFGLIYTNFFPLIGEYEKREVYDDIDSKYAIFWIKRMIESNEYNLQKNVIDGSNGYVRFQCKDFTNEDSKNMCRDLVRILQVNNCNAEGNYCDIYVTNYQVRKENDTSRTWFKNKVKTNLKRYEENCTSNCLNAFVSACQTANTTNHTNIDCNKFANQKVFTSAFKDYMDSLPDYIIHSSNGAKFRVFAIFHNTKDATDYLTYSTIEVNR